MEKAKPFRAETLTINLVKQSRTFLFPVDITKIALDAYKDMFYKGASELTRRFGLNDLNEEASRAKMKERAFARLDEWIAASREQKWPPDRDAIRSVLLQRAEYLGVSYEIIISDHPGDFVKQIMDRKKKRPLKDDQFWNQFENQLRIQLWHHLRIQLRNQFWNQIRIQLWGHRWGQLWELKIVCDCLWNGLAEKDRASIKNYNMYMLEASQNGMFFCFTPKDYTFVLLAPRYTLDDQRRLHNEDECALEWPNGAKQYWYHGVRVPEEVILDPRSLSREQILSEPNPHDGTLGLRGVP